MTRILLAATALAFLMGAPAAYAQDSTPATTKRSAAPQKPSTPSNAMGAPEDCSKMTDAKMRNDCMAKAKSMHKKKM